MLKPCIPVPSTSPFFILVQCSLKVLFTHNVKKIKDAVHSNGDIDGTCKRSLKVCLRYVLLSTRVICCVKEFLYIRAKAKENFSFDLYPLKQCVNIHTT